MQNDCYLESNVVFCLVLFIESPFWMNCHLFFWVSIFPKVDDFCFESKKGNSCKKSRRAKDCDLPGIRKKCPSFLRRGARIIRDGSMVFFTPRCSNAKNSFGGFFCSCTFALTLLFEEWEWNPLKYRVNYSISQLFRSISPLTFLLFSQTLDAATIYWNEIATNCSRRGMVLRGQVYIVRTYARDVQRIFLF